MELHAAIRQAAVGRIGVGAALLAKPDIVYGWIGDEADGRGARVLTRALGARDLVIGAGTAAKAGDPNGLRSWLLAGIVADAVDCAATLSAPSAPGRKLVIGLAASSTLAGLFHLVRTR